MNYFGIKQRTTNVTRFDTDSKKIAKEFKDFLEEKGIPYTTVILWTHYDGPRTISFRIFGSRKHNPDLLGKFFELERV